MIIINNVFKNLQKKWVGIILFFVIIWNLFLILVGISWLVGYYSNAILNTHFDLQSCISGIGASFGGISTLLMAGGASWLRNREKRKLYENDSIYNSMSGQAPTRRGRRGAE